MSFVAVLTTRGRVTGKPHSKPLRAVKIGQTLYFTRHRPDSDWFLNALACTRVSVSLDSGESEGEAFRVVDEQLLAKISQISTPAKRAHPRRASV